jgi:hypothetical protein
MTASERTASLRGSPEWRRADINSGCLVAGVPVWSARPVDGPAGRRCARCPAGSHGWLNEACSATAWRPGAPERWPPTGRAEWEAHGPDRRLPARPRRFPVWPASAWITPDRDIASKTLSCIFARSGLPPRHDRADGDITHRNGDEAAGVTETTQATRRRQRSTIAARSAPRHDRSESSTSSRKPDFRLCRAQRRATKTA